MQKQIQNNYASTTIPSVDGIVAGALCKDGLIHYHLKEYSGINNEWVCAKVCPNITIKFGKVLGAVLGRALLWSVYDSKQSNVVPAFMVERIKNAYSNIVDKQVADGENPVAKVSLYINGGTNGNLILEPLIEDIGEEVDDNETAEKRLERLQKRYKESNLRDRSIK